MKQLNSKNKSKGETIQMLVHQLDSGFIPRWFITYHYSHPYDFVRPVKETNRALGYGDRISYQVGGDIWKQVERDKKMIKKRKSYDGVEKDSIEIQKVILQQLFDIKYPNKYWKYELPALLFFHEKGKKKKVNDNFTYHTHLFMPDVVGSEDKDSITDIFETSIRKRRKCFSKWKKIDVQEIYEPKGALKYVQKETNDRYNSFDYLASLIIHPVTKQVIPYTKNKSYYHK